MTSSTSAATRFSGSSDRHSSSCRQNGRMQLVVLPVPMAPKIISPVNSPFSGIRSHFGRGTSRSSMRWCTSPMTSDGDLSVLRSGHGGSFPAKRQSSSLPAKTRRTDSATDEPTKNNTPGANNDISTNQL